MKFMGLNKGEWSELYAILYLLENRKLKIVDSDLNILDECIYIVDEIISERKDGEVIFLIDDSFVTPIIFGDECTRISIDQIRELRRYLYHEIVNAEMGPGAFNINFVQNWLEEHQLDTKFKAKSDVKSDIALTNLDIQTGQRVKLSYSVKSQLGSPATILNASSHTDFCYKILNFPKDRINEINSINSSTKLVDRIQRIIELGGEIQFNNVKSSVFDNNLRLIDSDLPRILGQVLLSSYITGTKNLYMLFESVYGDTVFARKKLSDFLFAISFGMFPGSPWNGYNTVDGGIIVVASDSEVYVLDLIYFKNQVEQYLFNQTKLDSPSSRRYNMLNLYEEDDEVYFTLNLQIRYK